MGLTDMLAGRAGMAQGCMPPTMANHSVIVQRLTRDGKAWVSVERGASVAPGEALRLLAAGIDNQTWHTPTFSISTVRGKVFEESELADMAGSHAGEAWVTLTAPYGEASYFVEVSAQSLPFLPKTHLAETTFLVRQGAPPRPDVPDSPPGTIEQLKGLGIVAAVILVLVLVGPKLAKLLPDGKE